MRRLFLFKLGAGTIVSYGTTQYLFGLLIAPLHTTFHWSVGSISLAYGMSSVVAGIAGIPIGYWLDRISPRAILAGGSALGGLCLLGLARMDSLWQLYALWSLGLGIYAAATWYNVTFVAVGKTFGEKTAQGLGVLSLYGALCSPIMMPLAGRLIATQGWRGALTALGAVVLIVALPLHASIEPAFGRLARAEKTPGGDQRGGQYTLRHATFWLLTGACGLAMFSTTILLVHQIAYMLDKGLSLAQASTLAGGLGLVYLPGRLMMIPLLRRVSAAWLLVASIALQAAAGILLVVARDLLGVAAYILAFGFGYGAFSPLRAALMHEYFGEESFGAFLGVQGFVLALTAAAGAYVGGALFDHYGSYRYAFTLSASVFAAGAALLALADLRHRALSRL